jgi:putative transcriptional regulator
MTIQHHPDDSMLSAFAAGTLDLGQHVAIATHLASCPRCRGWIRTMEEVGGSVLTGLPPTAMSSGSLEQIEARLDVPVKPKTNGAEPDVADLAIADLAIVGLPEFVRRYWFGRWQWIAPRVHLRPITLPVPGKTRVFLLRSGPGTRMLEHSHTGIEMTCVLKGVFSHEGGHFGPGDFDLGDETVNHRPVVDAREECVCLVAMVGDLRLSGLIGRIVQPFVRL